MDGELRRRARTVGIRHQDDAFQPLAIAAVHMRQESAERILPLLPRALVDVMRDIFGQARQHRFAIVRIERSVIALEKV